MKVKIIYSPFLEEIYSSFFSEKELVSKTKLFTYSTLPHFSKDEVLVKQEEFRNEWRKNGEKMIDKILEVSELKIERRNLDVYITGVPARSFSSPIVIYAGKDTGDFIRVLIHEIVHIVLNEGLGDSKKYLEEVLANLFPSETKLTQIHILVYAIMGAVFEEVLGNVDMMSSEIRDAGNFKTPEYKDALGICINNGYKNILDKIKMEYKKHMLSIS